MGTIKSKQIAQSEIVRLEGEINGLWEEINSCNISNAFRLETEAKLQQCEEEFKSVMVGQVSFQSLERKLREIDKTLAKAVIEHAEQEIQKGDLAEVSRLALDSVRHQFNENKITAIRARHLVKEIIRKNI